MVVVRLAAAEIAFARKVGLMRMRASGNTGRNPARSETRTDDKRVRDEVLGCMAEHAVANYLGIPYWGSINTFHAEPDVGLFDVRATPHPSGCLIIRDNDDDDRPLILVTGRHDHNELILRGWLRAARDGKKKWYRRNPYGKRPCWMVPQSDLLPIPHRHTGGTR